MNVLFMNPTGRIGGAETALLEAMTGIRDLEPSARLTLIVASDGPLVGRARALDVNVRVLPFPDRLARLGEWSLRARRGSRLAAAARCLPAAWPAWRYLARLRRLLRELAPDIVHTNGLKMHVLGAWAAPPAAALVWHVHDYVTSRRLSAWLMKRSARACSAIVAPSQSVAGDVRALVGSAVPVRAIWNAVDLHRFSPDGDRLDLDSRSNLGPPEPGVVRVGLVATLAPWKGHRTFLDAMALLPPGLNVRGYVIGGRVYETDDSQLTLSELRERAARLGLAASVGFTGYLDDPAPAIRALDVVVHASTEREPFGLAIAEGFACGRAVIVSYAGGAAEIVVPGSNALACAPGDAADLARCIRQLSEEPGLRSRLGSAARATAERAFTRDRMARAICDLYDDVMRRSAAGARPRSIGGAPAGEPVRVPGRQASNP